MLRDVAMQRTCADIGMGATVRVTGLIINIGCMLRLLPVFCGLCLLGRASVKARPYSLVVAR